MKNWKTDSENSFPRCAIRALYGIYRTLFSPDRGVLRPLMVFFFPLAGSPGCRFAPSCSEYALEATRQYGLFRGSVMLCVRVLRCGPLSRGGYDPVPRRAPEETDTP